MPTAEETLKEIKAFVDNAGHIPTAMGHIRAALKRFFQPVPEEEVPAVRSGFPADDLEMDDT